MPRLVRRALSTFGCFAGMLAAGVVAPSVACATAAPHISLTYQNRDPSNPGKNSFIAVVGQNNAGTADPCESPDAHCGDFQVTAIDENFQRVYLATVSLDFSDCTDIQLSCDQLQSTTGQLYITGHQVHGDTNPSGNFTFKVQGASNSTSTLSPPYVSPGTPAGTPCIKVTVNGYTAAPLTTAAFDIDGSGSVFSSAVNAADVAIVKIEALLSSTLGSRARADYNYDGQVNAGDVGISARLAVTPPNFGTVKTTNTGFYCNP